MSGSTIGGVLGAAIGFVVTGFNPTGAYYGWVIGAAVGAAVDPEVIKGPKLTDPQQQTSQEGVPRPVVYSTAAVAGNVIQVQSVPTRHTKRERTGKGGPIQETYTYTRVAAIRICEAAPLGGEMKLRRAWMNGKLVLDRTGSGQIDAESAKLLGQITFYSGSESQLPDPTLESLPAVDGGGVGNVSAYRGSCYVVLKNVDVTQTGGALPQFLWEVSSDAEEGTAETDLDALQYSDDVFPWRENAHLFADPRRPGVEYEYGYIQRTFGYDATHWGYASPEAAVDAAIAANHTNGNEYSALNLRGWKTYSHIYEDGSTIPIWPWAGTVYDANEQQALGLVFARHSFSVELVDGDATPSGVFPGTNSCLTFHEPHWIYDADAGGSGNVSGVYVRSQYAEANAGADNGFYNCYEDGVLNGTGLSGGTGSVRIYADFVVMCRPVLACQGGPDADWLAVPDVDGYYVDVDGVLHVEKDCEEVSGTYKQLALSDTVSSSDPTFNTIAQGPLYESGGASDTQTVWDAAYADAVSAGTLPAGMTYQANGLGGETTYPRAATTACECTSAAPTPVTPNAVYLDAIVADLCERVEVTDYDVSALSAIEVRGFPLTQQVNAAGAIQALQQVYLFDFPEWGNSGDTTTTLRAVLRGGATSAAITDDDIVDNDDEEVVRAQQVEFPRKVTLFAQDPDANYEITPQAAERESENVKATGEISISTAIVMTRDEKARNVDILHKVMWEEATGSMETELPEEFSRLVPSDIVTYGGRRYRVSRTELGDGTLKIEGTRDRASAYSSSAAGSDHVDVPSPASGLRGPTVLYAWNLPRLRTQDTSPGMYLLAQGLLPGWVGADIYLSLDGGTTYAPVATILSPSTLGEVDEFATVDGEPIAVRVYYDGELESVTTDQLAARANGFAIVAANGTAEVGQFQTATETASLRYDLTDISRGQLGTEATSHFAGEQFGVLDAFTFLPIDVIHAGKTLFFKAVSRGTSLDATEAIEVVYSPLFTSPESIEFLLDETGDNLLDETGAYLIEE